MLIAEAAVAAGDHDEAIRRYEQLLALQPQATRLYQPLAMAYRAVGRTEDARRIAAARRPISAFARAGVMVAGSSLMSASLPAPTTGSSADIRQAALPEIWEQ